MIRRRGRKRSADLRRTPILALALTGLFPGAGPTWHSYVASSVRVALVILRLKTPVVSWPRTV